MNPAKQHIIIVTSEFPPQPGGIGNHAYNLALYLYKNDYSVQVIADQRSNDGNEEVIFDSQQPFKVNRIRMYNWRVIMYVKRILLTFKTMKTANYIIATGKFSLWNVAFCNLFYKHKIMAVTHGSEVNFKSKLMSKSIDTALKQFDIIVAVSNYTKGLISHLKKQIDVIPNGIDNTKWNPNNNNKSTHLIGNPIITTVGRVSSRKGQLNVIKQLPELIKSYPELHYHCIGIPTETEAFIKIAKELNVESYVTFHGKVDDISLKNMLNLTDIFVMLSTESDTGDVEGYGIAILEANAMGIPAIGAKGCGIEDAIKQNSSGILIDANNTNEFKFAIDEILQRRSSYKIEAKKWALSHDWDQIVQKYITALKKI